MGRLAEATDLNGVKATYTYSDPLDRPTQFLRSPEQITFSYPDFSTVSTARAQNSCGQTQSVVTTQVFDGLGRLERSQLAEGGGRDH